MFIRQQIIQTELDWNIYAFRNNRTEDISASKKKKNQRELDSFN